MQGRCDVGALLVELCNSSAVRTPLSVLFMGTCSANTSDQLRLAQFLTPFIQLTGPPEFGTSESFFVERFCQNLSLQGNSNTSKQSSCFYSLKVRRQNKGLKQQTVFFISLPKFSTFLESIYKVTSGCSVFLAGRCWLLASCHCDCGIFREPCPIQHGLARSKPTHVPLAGDTAS